MTLIQEQALEPRSSSPTGAAEASVAPPDRATAPAHVSGAVAIVGLGAVLPDAPSAPDFWHNVCAGRYSISEVPADRWRREDYYHPDPKVPDKTYSKIGAWVRGFEFDWKRFRVPPTVAACMDPSQQWAVAAAAEALADYGFPARPLDTDRTGVILGTAMGGQYHLESHLRISYPEYERLLEATAGFQALDPSEREQIRQQWRERVDAAFRPITEDTMPGELANVVSGRVANVLNLRGPNFITDAACASSLAAVSAAMKMLLEHHCDAVLTGGVDHNMSASTFVKFSKVGALSARGSFPFSAQADGFVMGEGCAVLLLRRLEDAERDGDPIYAVIRGIGVSSDGKGKGITAPNPLGQALAIRRAWEDAGFEPTTATLLEAHGTSTVVGDRVELETLREVLSGAEPGSIALGSVKGNIGHLKAAAGAAGLLKVAYALRDKVLPPTLHAAQPNAAIDFERAPYYLNHAVRPWADGRGTPRRAGISSYGFGGTNFHLVLEEHVPAADRQTTEREPTRHRTVVARAQAVASPEAAAASALSTPRNAAPPRGILAVGAESRAALGRKLVALRARLADGWQPAPEGPDVAELGAEERVVLDFATSEELGAKLGKAIQAAERDSAALWQALEPQGLFRGSGPARGKLAFLFPGQGSQYLNMGRELAGLDPVAAQVFAEADAVMEPILGRSLSSFVFAGKLSGEAAKQAELALTDTAITQPAVISVDIAICRLLERHGFVPDMVMGHSLGEYAALVAAGVMPLAHALEATAARGREMSSVQVADKGLMAAVFAPAELIERTLRDAEGYVVMANINSPSQCVIGGESRAVEQAVATLEAAGHRAVLLPVSHAFHTRIVAAASQPLRRVLDRLDIRPPRIPVVSNVTAEPYPANPTAIKDLLQQQVAAPVRWSSGLLALRAAGARTFVEVGPKKALKGFVDDLFRGDTEVVSLFTNHPKTGELASLNHALCGLFAAGYGIAPTNARPAATPPYLLPETSATREDDSMHPTDTAMAMNQVSGLLAQALAQLADLDAAPHRGLGAARPYDQRAVPAGSVVVTGTGLGLPGAEKPVMAPDNIMRLLRGEQLIDLVPERFRQAILRKHVTRLVKDVDGSGSFQPIADESEVIKLAGRPGAFDLAAEYGVPSELCEALDITTQLAMAAGLDALREAGIPLVQSYRTTRTGKQLPDRWLLPESMRDETGVVFASAFPGLDRFADELRRYHLHQSRRERLEALGEVQRVTDDPAALGEIARQSELLRYQLATEEYSFDRRFLFRVLPMGHGQFAQYIGARGPNTHVNTACASAGTALGLAEDWIRTGRCRRVVVIGGDAVTSNNLLEWFGAGFQAAGAAATDGRVADAALPFDRRRHGLVLGMGASALVVESEDAVRERGMRAMAELVATETGNSAFHGTRLDAAHVAAVMDRAVATGERRFGLNRHCMAQHTVFLSHETYTPARGGSASAEVAALRHTFGDAVQDVLITNTKGHTGHPMGAGIEAVTAVNVLEHGLVPPVANFQEPDPDLGPLRLSRGGRYPAEYTLVFSAGFGSQVAVSLLRRIGGGIDRVEDQPRYRAWLGEVSGHDAVELEVQQRVLRIKARCGPTRAPSPSRWTPGLGPAVRVHAAPATMLARPHDSVWPLAMPSLAPSSVVPSTMPPPAGLVPPSTPPPAAPVPATTPPPAALAPPSMPPPAALVPPATPPPANAVLAPTAKAADGRAPSDDPRDPVAAEVIRVIARKTGYPEDMLELDLDLEADLGIDTVKQAETFAEVREAFAIPRREDLRLRDYPTLRAVVGFVKSSRPELARPPSAELDTDTIAAEVIRIIARKTGYPEDMLELELDLEADLGIDTVKQAETFAEVREAFAIPRREDLRLRDYPTLAKVVQFVKDSRAADARVVPPALEPAAAQLAQTQDDAAASGTAVVGPSAAATASEHAHRPATTRYRLEDAGRVPRRVPVPIMRPPLGMCSDTGIALGAHERVIVAPDAGGVGAALGELLAGRQVEALVLEPSLDAGELCARIEQWLTQGPIAGLYWLAALDAEPELASLEPPLFVAATERRVKALSHAMRTLSRGSDASGRFLVCGTRLGGVHGYGSEGAAAPLGGAVVGFAKALQREQPSMLVKAVDFGLDDSPERVASVLLDETLRDPAALEIGYEAGVRLAISLEERAVGEGLPLLTLDASSVFVVTGAAGGITSAIVEDLAQASGGTFHLLDLAAEPQRDDPDIALFCRDREALKRALCQRGKSSGQRATPQEVERELGRVERAAAALAAIEAVEAAGGQAHYHALDVTDAMAVSRVVDVVRERHGRIDALIHAAGIELSRRLCDKSPAEFDRVFDVKAHGLFNLLTAARDLPIDACVVFSSVAGRFGNAGQTDYSAANDLLCKIASTLARRGTRGIAIDWTAWASIGMASRGSLPAIMAKAGIEPLPPEVGVPTVRRELLYNPGGEVVVASALGSLLEERDPCGGLDPERARGRLQASRSRCPMIGELRTARLLGRLETETRLDPKAEPFLSDHQLEPDLPLLPGVMGLEAFAEVATVLAPSLTVTTIEQVAFQSPFKFYGNEPRALLLGARISRSATGQWLAEVTLDSLVKPRGTELPGQRKQHFSATVRMSAGPLHEAPRIAFAAPSNGHVPIGHEEIYRTYFHGPAYRVLERAYVDATESVGVMAADLPIDSATPDAVWLVAPRLLELGLQTAGLWSLVRHGKMALPRSIGAVRLYQGANEASDALLYAVAKPLRDGATFDVRLVDASGRVLADIEEYATIAIEPLATTLAGADARMAEHGNPS